MAKGRTIGDSQETWMETTVWGKGTIKLWWKMTTTQAARMGRSPHPSLQNFQP
jgi:hypothetical protein